MPDHAYKLTEGYRIEVLSESATTTKADVIAFWEREEAVSEGKREARSHEVVHVALDSAGSIAGVSTAYLARNEQLRMDLWHQRGFVGRDHRKSNIGMLFALLGIDHLQHRFVTGKDMRAQGMIQSIENEGLKRYFNLGRQPPTYFTFIGESERGDHVRVVYFPGALAPGLPRTSG